MLFILKYIYITKGLGPSTVLASSNLSALKFAFCSIFRLDRLIRLDDLSRRLEAARTPPQEALSRWCVVRM